MKLVRLVVVASVLTIGFSSFTPVTFGCGGMGGSGCREAGPAKLEVLAAGLRAIFAVGRIVLP